MLLLKSSDWMLEGICDGLLKFKNLRFENEFYLTKRAKVLDKESNKVTFLDAELADAFEKYMQERKVEELV